MKLWIPETLTYSLNNKCTWDIYSREREIDSQVDITRPWEETEDTLETTDPVLVQEQDAIMMTAALGLVASKVIFKIWVQGFF